MFTDPIPFMTKQRPSEQLRNSIRETGSGLKQSVNNSFYPALVHTSIVGVISNNLENRLSTPSKRLELAFEQSVNNECLSNLPRFITCLFSLTFTYRDRTQISQFDNSFSSVQHVLGHDRLLLCFILVEQKLNPTSVHI